MRLVKFDPELEESAGTITFTERDLVDAGPIPGCEKEVAKIKGELKALDVASGNSITKARDIFVG